MGFGENLMLIRKSCGLSRREFAELLSIPYKTLQNYETDQREPGSALLIKMSSLLGVSVDSIIGNQFITKQNKTKQNNTSDVDKRVCSPRAMQVAEAYDRADKPIQAIVDTALEPYTTEGTAKESDSKLA